MVGSSAVAGIPRAGGNKLDADTVSRVLWTATTILTALKAFRGNSSATNKPVAGSYLAQDDVVLSRTVADLARWRRFGSDRERMKMIS